MQSENLMLGGFLQESYQSYDWQYGSEGWYLRGIEDVSNAAPRYQYSRVLVAGPMIKGDRNRPNPWSYTKTVHVAPHGKWTRLQGQRFPKPHIIRTDVSGYFASDVRLTHCSYPISMAGYKTEDILDALPTTSRQKCLQKLWDAVKDSEVNLGTTVGEGKESIVMLRDIATRALAIKRQLIDLAIKRKRRQILEQRRASRNASKSKTKRERKRKSSRDDARAIVEKAPETVAGLWLGWSVGLAPLISDCENIRNHSWTDKPLIFSVKARASDKFTVPFNGANGLTEQGQLSERVQMGMTMIMRDVEQYEVFRSGAVLRPTLAWELVTLSFVVDYFVQIGGYLQCLEAGLLNNGLEFHSGYETTVRRKDLSQTKRVDPGPAIDYNTTTEQTWGECSMSKYQVDFNRKLMTSFPMPVRPVVKLPQASTALLNCAALLQLLFLSPKR